jgi:hypothetical protein
MRHAIGASPSTLRCMAPLSLHYVLPPTHPFLLILYPPSSDMADMMITFQQFSRDVSKYHEQQKFYVNIDWETADYYVLRTAAHILSMVIGDIHTTFEQEDLSTRYDFYTRKWVEFRLKYHGVEDIKELKWFLSTVELKQRLYLLELAKRDIENKKEEVQNLGVTNGP